MASNASDDGQTNTLILFTTHSNPTVPTYPQRASDYSLDGNTNASTTDFQLKKYANINWKYLLGYHVPHPTSGEPCGPTQKYGYDIKHGKIDMVDGQLKHPQKEGTGHIRQEGDLTLCQDSQQTYIKGRGERNDGKTDLGVGGQVSCINIMPRLVIIIDYRTS